MLRTVSCNRTFFTEMSTLKVFSTLCPFLALLFRAFGTNNHHLGKFFEYVFGKKQVHDVFLHMKISRTYARNR